MTRDEAYNLMIQMLRSRNLQRHGLAVEAIMKALCKYLKDRLASQGVPLDPKEFDEEEWAIVGLLHDADYELVEKDPTRHTLVTAEKLRSTNASDRIINGIKAHHEGIKNSRDNLMEKSVYASDELSGLITAVALVRPDKDPLRSRSEDSVALARGTLSSADAERKNLGKLEQVTVESVLKKFPQKSFAAGAKREQILSCEKQLNIPLEEFVGIALKAMQGISNELGL